MIISGSKGHFKSTLQKSVPIFRDQPLHDVDRSRSVAATEKGLETVNLDIV
jgi:hypothetical protein